MSYNLTAHTLNLNSNKKLNRKRKLDQNQGLETETEKIGNEKGPRKGPKHAPSGYFLISMDYFL